MTDGLTDGQTLLERSEDASTNLTKYGKRLATLRLYKESNLDPEVKPYLLVSDLL